MRRYLAAFAATAIMLIAAPPAGHADPSYTVLLAGSRCASAYAASSTAFSSAWVCTGVQSTQATAESVVADQSADGLQRTQRAFGCISIADFVANEIQRACGPVSDSALTSDPALQQAKLDFFLVTGEKVLAVRVVLTGEGPVFVDHVLGEVGTGETDPSHRARAYGVARLYRGATLTGFILGRGVGGSVGGTRGMISNGVAGFATIDAGE